MIFLVWELVIIIGVLFLDMLTKGWAETYLVTLPGNSLPLIDGVFHFTYTKNTGAAFSMLEGQRVFFLITAAIAIVGIVAFLIFSKAKSKLLRTGLSLMLGGTIGNAYDRLVFAYVRDMLDFRLINFAIFNVADSALCIGVALVCVFVIFYYKPDDKKGDKAEEIESSEPKAEVSDGK